MREALGKVAYPGFTRDVVSFGLVKGIEVKGGRVAVSFALTSSDPEVAPRLKADAERALGSLEGVEEVEITVAVKAKPASGGDAAEPEGAGGNAMQKVRVAIAVASGKGGVGKSTFTVNLACAMDRILRQEGRPNRVGIMDCDIYGPSIPLMLGVNQRPEVEDGLIVPLENFGVRVMSMGFLVEEDIPVIWRGPMVMKTIQQFAGNVNWGELEVLFVDLPPGTGDAQLSLVQTVPLDGAVIVTTPQLAAVNVARRGSDDVREGQRASPGCRREHELSAGREDRRAAIRLRRRGRRADGGPARNGFSRPGSPRSPDRGGLRSRRAHCNQRSGSGMFPLLSPHRRKSLGAVQIDKLR